MDLPPQVPDSEESYEMMPDRHRRWNGPQAADLPPQLPTYSMDRPARPQPPTASIAAPAPRKPAITAHLNRRDPDEVPETQLSLWRRTYGDQVPSRASDLICWACQDPQRMPVLTWVWAGGGADTPQLPVVLHPSAAENAALAGNTRALDWLWAANDRFGRTGPMIATPITCINASLGDHTEILEWFVAHARSSPHRGASIFHHTAAAVDSASQAGSLNVLSWWWDASTRSQDRLEFLFSAAAIESAAANKQWRTLRWWCERRDSHGLRLLYDPQRLSAAAIGILEATPGQAMPPRPNNNKDKEDEESGCCCTVQ
ncbi:hypothetical protein BC828DRAFT_381677 [Blastocladiella britannica]|nr:hypothetical protein BC828DRAFT_381677 [Blastocladiella britannica]